MVGYLTNSRSLLHFKAAARTRAAGVFTACLCLGAAFLFTPAVSYFPRPVLAGLLVFLGLSMLREWVWDAFFKLPLLEYTLIGAILLLMVLQGLIAGVAFGLLVASVFFVYSYSRTSCIRHNFASSTHFSNRERPLEQIALLKERGTKARTLVLQGYLFFGTSNAVVETCRELIETEKLEFLLLDFRMVQGLDASAVLSFNKLEQICRSNGVALCLCGLRPELEAVLRQTQFLPRKGVKVFADTDRGLEYIEDGLLEVIGGMMLATPANPADAQAAIGASAILAEMDLRRILAEQFTPAALNVLIGYCETLKLKAGTPLFKRGDPGDALYFIERGRLSVLLRLDDGQTKRLRTFGAGTVVGEMALYSKQPRSADVVADDSCRVRKLSAENLARLEREHPEVAIQFHTYVVKLLSSRLAAANEEIRGLL
ncbi:MAG: cyclic nucleotide-binding domain-containing protein [Planctomycetota bacterium]|nr:cyclic nucleotide-binding domain-containing protein [Planctomycetota bacterium]